MSYGLISMVSNDYSSTLKRFQQAIKQKLATGWVLVGERTHVIDEKGIHYMTQAVVKYWHSKEGR